MGACSSSIPTHETTLKPVTPAMREQGLKDGVDAYQFPRMKIFNKMAPAHLVTLFALYTKALSEGAFNYFTPQECEVIFAAISAVNNCEFCLSFHAMQMAQHGVSAADVQAISNGGGNIHIYHQMLNEVTNTSYFTGIFCSLFCSTKSKQFLLTPSSPLLSSLPNTLLHTREFSLHAKRSI